MSTLLLTVLGLRGCWPVNVDPLNEKKESLDKLSSEYTQNVLPKLLQRCTS